MNKLTAVLRLTRIEHSLMSAVAVVAAELIARGLPSLPILLLSIISPIFINMMSFAINDYFDIEVDRKNKKMRPLVTGDLKPRDALYVTAITFVIGVLASIFINPICFAIALVFALLDLLYCYKLKEVPLVGNAYVALAMAIAFVFGSYVVTSSLAPSIVIVTILVFLSGVAREVHGTMRDYEGDIKVRNARTLPKVIGIRASAWFAAVLYALSILLSVYLFLTTSPFKYNPVFGILFAVADAMLLYVSYVFLSSKKQSDYDKTRNISLGAMAIAIIALLLSPLMLL